MNQRTVIDWIALILVLVGGLNWGLVGVFQLNLVEILFNSLLIQRVVYTLVGLATLWKIWRLIKKPS